MDPERVKAYLQAACAGLGFDVGEVWWTTGEDSPAAVAAAEDGPDGTLVRANQSGQHQHLKFVQLYTSKSFENHRDELINPPNTTLPEDSTEDLSEHVLSPQLVKAISATSDVVWANTKKQEGLAGRSDIHFQTAVGMPVAVDGHGSMCVVVMFSPSNISSTDDALDFLRSISQGAVSPSVSCLLPVFDSVKTGMRLPDHGAHPQGLELAAFGEGITARFVSIADLHSASECSHSHSDHELSTAPKDTFGIPMLPSFAEIGNISPDENIDVFDEASYGVWTTIMDTYKDDFSSNDITHEYDINKDVPTTAVPLKTTGLATAPRGADLIALQEQRKTRLEEFCSAFLGMSVFDLADVWVPAGEPYADSLRNTISITSTDSNEFLNQFVRCSKSMLIKFWTGAVGRAFSSGNPVWTGNPTVYVDPARAEAFNMANIRTVLSIPVFSGKQALPTCVVSFYSFVRTGSVPFVLRFVQQALRLLWDGLEVVEPHESVKKNIWKDVQPADLGEMAADVEMQHHFIKKKRPHNLMSQDPNLSKADPLGEYLSAQFRTASLPDPEPIGLPTDEADVPPAPDLDPFQAKSAKHVQPLSAPFGHLPTNREGTKRAHVMAVGPLPGPMRLPTRVMTSRKANSASPPAAAPPFHTALPSPAVPPPVQAADPSSVPVSASVPTQSLIQPQHLLNEASLSQVPMELPPNMPLAAAVFITDPSLASNPQFCMPAAASTIKTDARDIKMCRIQGCSEPAVSRRPHCVKHSGNRLCEREGCTKCAQGSTRFCIAHGGGRRCTFPGCDKGARDKFFCAAHGGGKRCSHDGCSKSAVGGSKLCTAHGGGRRCAVEGCDKSAQSSTKFCVKHGGGKKCAHGGCEKVARGRTQFCAAHGGGVRCKLEGCNRVAIGKRQLCRAHGGGSRTKKAAPPQQFQPAHMQLTQESLIGAIPGMAQYDYMTSV